MNGHDPRLEKQTVADERRTRDGVTVRRVGDTRGSGWRATGGQRPIQGDVSWDTENPYRQPPQTVSDSIQNKVTVVRERRHGGGQSREQTAGTVARVTERHPAAQAEYAPARTVMKVKKSPSVNLAATLRSVKVTKSSVSVLTWTLSWYFLHLIMVLIGFIGLGMVALHDWLSGSLQSVNTEEEVNSITSSLVGIFGSIMQTAYATASQVVEFFIGVNLADVGFGIFFIMFATVFLIGLASILFAVCAYLFTGTNPIKGIALPALILAIGLYYIPVVQLFPWIILYVGAMMWAHRPTRS